MDHFTSDILVHIPRNYKGNKSVFRTTLSFTFLGKYSTMKIWETSRKRPNSTSLSKQGLFSRGATGSVLLILTWKKTEENTTDSSTDVLKPHVNYWRPSTFTCFSTKNNTQIILRNGNRWRINVTNNFVKAILHHNLFNGWYINRVITHEKLPTTKGYHRMPNCRFTYFTKKKKKNS